jgi:hypothetical protein
MAEGQSSCPAFSHGRAAAGTLAASTGSSKYRNLAITPIRGYGSWSEDRFRGGELDFSRCRGWFADGEVGGDGRGSKHPGVKLRRSGPSRGSIRFGRRACFGRKTGTLYNRHPDGGRYVLRDVAQVTSVAQN